MRNRWDEKADEDLDDEPVTITHGQLKSLKRGVLFGTIALGIAVASMGLAAWSLLSGPPSTATETAASETSTETQTAMNPAAPVADPTLAPSQATPAAPPQATQPATQPAPVVAESKPVVAKPRAKKASAPAASTRKPEHIDPLSVPGITAPTTPVAAETKTAPRDTSSTR